MKTKKVLHTLVILISTLAVTGCLGSLPAEANPGPVPVPSGEKDALTLPDMGCTVIYAADEEAALGGNNEDYSNPFTMAWFLPAEEGKYGRVYFGFEGFLWGGGMNEKGLFFDAMAVDESVEVPPEGKPRYDGKLEDKIMAECADVECVIELFSQYRTLDTWRHQFLYGDAEGNSVIVEPLAFLRNEKNYQVATNFYQSKGYSQDAYQDNRYRIATNRFEAADSFSVDLLRDILDAVHYEEGSPTLYSQVYDLKTRTIHLYFFHDFENPVVINLEEELAKGWHAVALADLFPENQAYRDWAKEEIDWLQALRAAYPTYEGDRSKYEAYSGRYALPAEMGLPYPYYEIDDEGGTLMLKIYPDKGWLNLIPFAENSFYHVSSFSQFEVTFLPDEEGNVNQFAYVEGGTSFTFNRLAPAPSPTATQLVATPTPPAEEGGGFPSWLILPAAGLLVVILVYLILRNRWFLVKKSGE